jgi:hypothetical protein
VSAAASNRSRNIASLGESSGRSVVASTSFRRVVAALRRSVLLGTVTNSTGADLLSLS